MNTLKNFIFAFTIIGLLAACATAGEKNNEQNDRYMDQQIFGQILDSANVTGSILIYDSSDHTFISNDFEHASKGFLPASTFKIVNSIIALETGVVENDSTLILWDGNQRAMEIWEQDLYFRDAFRLSCVPCYQEIARKIGSERMNDYLKKLNYGQMQVDTGNIDVFWLSGESKISQFQQIDFLQRLYYSRLPIRKRTQNNIKSMMLLEEGADYKLYAKTGWAVREGNNIGWFVGFIESGQKVYFFASNIKPNEKFNLNMFATIRSKITLEAFKALKILN